LIKLSIQIHILGFITPGTNLPQRSVRYSNAIGEKEREKRVLEFLVISGVENKV
jgi:hypothetical protein